MASRGVGDRRGPGRMMGEATRLVRETVRKPSGGSHDSPDGQWCPWPKGDRVDQDWGMNGIRLCTCHVHTLPLLSGCRGPSRDLHGSMVLETGGCACIWDSEGTLLPDHPGECPSTFRVRRHRAGLATGGCKTPLAPHAALPCRGAEGSCPPTRTFLARGD